MLRATLSMHYRMQVDHHLYGCLRRGQPHEPARWEELIERRRKNLRAMQELTGAQLAAE